MCILPFCSVKSRVEESANLSARTKNRLKGHYKKSDIPFFTALFSLYFTNQQTPLLSAVPRPEEAEETEAEVLPKTTTRALMDVGIFTEAIPETVR